MGRRALLLAATLAVIVGTRPAPTLRANESGVAAVRAPAVAGTFYPRTASSLARALDALLARARPPVATEPVALVAPHAGFVFSGQIAADAWRQVEGREYEVVVILGPNHTTPGFARFAVPSGRAFRSPIGDVPLDRDLITALLNAEAGLVIDDRPHVAEHSIEVQLPFVQRMLPRARIVPIVVGTDDAVASARFGRALADALAGRRALVVASSDLSHYPSAADARALDRRLLKAISSLDPVQVTRAAANGAVVRGLVTPACGLMPILTAMSAARRLGATAATLVSAASSADVAVGDPDRAVGYGAVVFTRGEAASPPLAEDVADVPPRDGPVSSSGRRALLALARNTLTQFLDSETLPLPRDLEASLRERRQGAFVTLKKAGQLRGCIGRLVSDGPLPPLVSRVAFEAAFRDPRFRPVEPAELRDLELEISLLSAPGAVTSPREIVVGRDGVLLRKDGRSAVFLPQVAVEQGWNRDRMLDELCLKAGLDRRCWIRGASLATFRAEVFSEGAH